LQPKFIISGGGTGGHIFPAVAVANELKARHPDCTILFIGANGRMEMEKVPLEGFEIVGLNVSGLKRSLSLSNFKVIIQFVSSYFKARKILKEFKPDCVLGTGGYASLAVLRAATRLQIPTVIWEGNGHAGLTNRLLAKHVTTICTGLPDMDDFFPKEKVVHTGNPVRSEILNLPDKSLALDFFKLHKDKRTLFITGGSLGARTINECVEADWTKLMAAGIQVIWQTGKNFQSEHTAEAGTYIAPFLKEMNYAYAASDLVISRAGALSIAEIAAAGKASVLVPSPNVTDDHQTQNALKLTESGAAWLVKDSEARQRLIDQCLEIMGDDEKRRGAEQKVKTLAKSDATQKIADEMEKAWKH
jgi:UDP-N-acetylglucosamine--N-acetylmuramyl-(pentapeptide) pyrophosphoryl-undecaprenol N-acetylglucosamine transferase